MQDEQGKLNYESTTHVPKRGALMSLSNYIKLQKTRLTSQLMSGNVVDEAKDYPCVLCAGAGIVIKNVTLSTIEKPYDLIQHPKENREICWRESMICPTCEGNGLNAPAFISATSAKAVG
jgi:predicted methyltransferase